MTRPRRGTGLAVAGLVAAAAWWFCWVPYQPARMLHAIPRDAAAVSVHRDLAGRQAAWLGNPVTAGLLTAAAGTGEDARTLAAGPDFQATLRRFGRHELVAAFVPRMGPTAVDSYVFTAWLGARSHWLRWGLLLGGSALREEAMAGGHRYWVTDTDLVDGAGRALRFAVAFEEGLAIGCLSADPHNIRMAIGCYDRNLPSVLTREPRLARWLMDRAPADRGWLALPGLRPVRYAVSALAPDRLAGRLTWEGDWEAARPHAPVAPPALFGALPFAAATASRGLLATAATGEGWADDLRRLVDELEAPGLAVGLFGGDYGGRLRGIRVPAAVLAVPCGDAPAGVARMHRAVHRAGLRTGADLSVEPTPGTEPTVYAITVPGRSAYGALPPAERAAFCIADGWLLAASHQRTLQRLLERRGWAAPPPAAPAGDPGPDALRLDADLVRGEAPARHALAAYSLVRLLGGAGSPEAGQRLGLLRGQLAGWAALQRLAVRARPDEAGLVVDVEVGP